MFDLDFRIIETAHVDFIFPKDCLGVDVGQTLTKIVFYEEGHLNCYLYPTTQGGEAIERFLKNRGKNISQLHLTGGAAYNLFKTFSEKYKVTLIDEFESINSGVDIIYQIEKKTALSDALIVTLGTGTSLIAKRESGFEHIGGSALGGGTYLGLMELLTDISDYKESINLAQKGNRFAIDLKVGDIYDKEDDRVDLVFREFTAASFGKIQNIKLKDYEEKDILQALVNLIGENIGIISSLAAEKEGITKIVFCGGFLKDNKLLKNILRMLCKIREKKAIFIKNAEYMGAIGALMTNLAD